MKIDFKLIQLEKLLSQIRESHPVRKGKNIIVEDTIIDKVKKLLSECPTEKLSDLAFQFEIKEILACIELISSDKNDIIAQKAAKVVLYRPRNHAILKGWFKLIKYYPNDLLEDTLRRLIEIKQFEALENHPQISSRIPSWFVSTRIVDGIFRDYQKDSGYKNLDTYLTDNYIDTHSGLFKSAWRLLLCKGSENSLKRETPDRLLDEYNDIKNATYVKQFCQHYLNTFRVIRSWSVEILKFINNKYGSPLIVKTNIETLFWRDVSDEIKREYQKWLMLHHIDTFFDGERADFWRTFVEDNQVIQVKKILSGEGFLIDFERFGVVEFKNVGNAAYVYPPEVFKKYWNQNNYSHTRPEEYKNLSGTVKLTNWDGRIIHSGNWFYKTKPIINKLLRR